MTYEVITGKVAAAYEDYFIVSSGHEFFIIPILDLDWEQEESLSDEVEFFDPYSLDVGDEVLIAPVDPYGQAGFRRAVFM